MKAGSRYLRRLTAARRPITAKKSNGGCVCPPCCRAAAGIGAVTRGPQRPPMVSSHSAALPARIAENMTASLSIPLGHVAAHHRRQGDGREPPHHQPAPHPAHAHQGLLHATFWVGPSSARSKSIPRSIQAFAESGGPAVPRTPSAGKTWASPSTWRAKTGARQPDGPQYSQRPARSISTNTSPPSTAWSPAPRSARLTPRRLSGHHHLAHQSRHSRHHVLESAPDAWPGRHHRRGCHRLPRGVPGARPTRTRAALGISQGDDPHLHLRSPASSRVRSRARSSARSSPCSMATTVFYEEIFNHLRIAAPAPCAGRRIAVRCCPDSPRAMAPLQKEAGIIQMINAYRRARPPHRRSRPARRGAQLSS